MATVVDLEECLAHELAREIATRRTAGTVMMHIDLTEAEFVQLNADCEGTPLLMVMGTIVTFCGVAMHVDGKLVTTQPDRIVVPNNGRQRGP